MVLLTLALIFNKLLKTQIPYQHFKSFISSLSCFITFLCPPRFFAASKTALQTQSFTSSTSSLLSVVCISYSLIGLKVSQSALLNDHFCDASVSHVPKLLFSINSSLPFHPHHYYCPITSYGHENHVSHPILTFSRSTDS